MSKMLKETLTADNLLKLVGAALLALLVWNAKVIVANQSEASKKLQGIELKLERLGFLDEKVRRIEESVVEVKRQVRDLERPRN